MPDITTRQGMLAVASQLLTLSDLDWSNSLSADVFGQKIGQTIFYGGNSRGLIPARAAYLTGSDLVILVAGVRTPSQAGFIYTGSKGPLIGVGEASVNSAFAIAARQIWTELSPVIPGSYASVLLAGHSYGGAIAQVLSALWAFTNTKADIFCFSTGSPRVGDTSMSSALGRVTCVRLMNHNDPVPFFPPHFDEAPAGTIAAGLDAALAWSRYVHGPGGYVLSQKGEISGSEVPNQGAPTADVDLLGWLGLAITEGHPAHNLRTYVSRLAVGVPVFGPPVPPVPAGLKGEFEVPLTPALFNLGLHEGLVHYERLKDMSDSSVYIPPQYLPIAKTIQGQSSVFWFGSPLMTTNSFSNAKTISKYMRRWLRYMQRAKEFDNGVMDTAFIDYLAVASSPTSGFSPVLAVKY